MGFVHDSHGPNEITAEERSESFLIHAEGAGVDLAESPEFLLSDLPHLRAALDELNTGGDGLRERLLSPEAVEAAVRVLSPEWEPDTTEHTQDGEAEWDNVSAALRAALDAIEGEER